MRIVFWQNILSPHQSALTRALGEVGHEVIVVVPEEMTPDRSAMGWSIPDFGKAKIILSPGPGEVEALVAQAPAEAVHILGGGRWTRLGRLATRCCVQSGARLGIMSEAADDRGWRGKARWLRYTAERLSRGRHFDFILAMGQTGVRWFRRCGYPQARVFPYAYFTESPELEESASERSTSKMPELIYLGRCVAGKGIETLLCALECCKDLAWKLLLLGDGPVKPALKLLAHTKCLESRVSFLPSAEHSTAMQYLCRVDFLTLPSNGKEGWGAVVNEALMRGVPVICSDHCGAADLLRERWRGEVFPAGSVPALAKLMRKWIAQGKRTPESTARIKAWSCCIAGTSAARYLIAILDHVYQGGKRPEAPWRS